MRGGLTLFGGGIPHPGDSGEIEQGAGVQEVSGALQPRGGDLEPQGSTSSNRTGSTKIFSIALFSLGLLALKRM